MTYEYDFTVFIGRFQPFHTGHLQVILAGLEKSEQLIILIGSSWQPRNPRNPWTHAEREQMIRASLTPEQNNRLVCMPLMDMPYNDRTWVRNVQASVNGHIAAHYKTPHKPARVALIGHHKDETGYYLGLFPQWASVAIDNWQQISATPIREAYFDQPDYDLNQSVEEGVLPPAVATWLHEFAKTTAYAGVRDEMGFVRKYQSAWDQAPYAPIFVTVDAVVVQSGHVLMVERRANPGKGLWALPGGFLDQKERIEDACLRELREETRLKVPTPILRGSIKDRQVFDDPNRSARGRTITHAFLIELPSDASLPKVRGADDAKRARWIPLADLNPEQTFEDHYFIIEKMLGTSAS